MKLAPNAGSPGGDRPYKDDHTKKNPSGGIRAHDDRDEHRAAIPAAQQHHCRRLPARRFGLPDPKWIEAVTAIAVLRPGHAPDEAGLIAHARTQLAPFKVPKKVMFADKLPRNTAGKLLKRELRAHYAKAG